MRILITNNTLAHRAGTELWVRDVSLRLLERGHSPIAYSRQLGEVAAELRIDQVSGGMARRIALARAIVLDPELVLYDEPFSGLDPISMGVIANLIRNLNRATGATTLMVTHSMQQAVNLGDRLIMMHRGQGILDLAGAEKRRLRADDLLGRFEEVRRADLLDETAAEMLSRTYI